jgi:hypothetical protein
MIAASKTDRTSAPNSARRRSFGRHWFVLLLAAICLEGLARRFLPIPGPFLYFAKDVVLIGGVVAVGVHPRVRRATRRLVGPLPLVLAATALWCMVSLADPRHPSIVLGLVGARQYLLWWAAPVVVATALLGDAENRRSQVILSVFAIAIATLAAYQFDQPSDAPINAYVWGEANPARVAELGSTGRVRVTSTFSYISGFSNFVALMAPILLASAVSGRGRSGTAAYVAAGSLAATAAMSGSRATVLYLGFGILVVLAVSGALKTRRGKITLAAIGLASVLGIWLVPEAREGLHERFGADDNAQRFRDLAMAIPFYAISKTDFEMLGAGVGVLQNAGAALQFEYASHAEIELQRVLIELGLPGYLLVWFSRVLLSVALVRGARSLARASAPAWSGAAWAYAGLALLLQLSTDHVAQSLFFLGNGILLAQVARLEPALSHARPSVRSGVGATALPLGSSTS